MLAALASAEGEPYGALLIAPAHLPAGRITSGDSHWVRTGDRLTPVAETDYARDASFGFVSSDLKLYVEEKTGGRVPASTVLSIGLDDIRLGGPDRVCDIILSARGATPIVVSATVEADLDVAVLGLTKAEARGARVLCRTGPSFVAARIGLEPRAPLTHDDIFASGNREGNGPVVVGSHVELTTAQVDHLVAVIPDIAVIELDVIAWDGPVPNSQVLGYIDTNNVAAGEQAGEALFKSIGGKGKVAAIIGSLSAVNLKQRLDGVKRALAKHPGITVVATQESNESIATAQSAAETILQANPDLGGFIGIGGSDLPGIAGALESGNTCGTVKSVGFHVVPQGIDGMKGDCVDALISQKPCGMRAQALPS